MIYVVATSQVKPELRDAFIKGARECIAATRKEKGCIAYATPASTIPTFSWWSSAGKAARISMRTAGRRI